MRILPALLALGLALSGAAVPGAPTPAEEGSVTVLAAPMLSGALIPGRALQVIGTVTNGTSQNLEAGEVAVFLDDARMTDRVALDAWLEPAASSSAPRGTLLGSVPVGTLAPRQSRSFTVMVPPAAIDLPSSPGAYPLTVTVTTGSVELGRSRSALTWDPTGSLQGSALAIAMPIVTPPGTTGLLSAEELTAWTAPDGLLTAQLDTALAHSIAVGVDPMILASIRILGTSAPASAVEWLDRFALLRGDTFALNYADADQALLSRAGGTVPLAPISFPIDPELFAPESEETPPPIEAPSGSPSAVPTPESLVAGEFSLLDLAWPRDDSIGQGDLAALRAAGYSRVLLNSAEVGVSPVTPNVLVDDVAVSVSDDDVSLLLRSAASATTELDWRHAMTSLAAHLAVAGAEHRGTTLLATLGREGSSYGPRLGATLTALEELPWVTPTRLSDTISGSAASARLVPAAESPDRVRTVTELLASEAATEQFSSVVVDPTLVTGPRRLSLLALLASSWASDAEGWARSARAYVSQGEELLDSVHIPDSSTITFLQEKGNLPIAVMNELDFPVTVYVTVQPERAILDVLDDRVELTIEANSQAKASIPVQSIANGEVRTKVFLTSPAGVLVSTPAFVVLNVQAGWETAATVVLAIIVVALFAAGIARTVLRWRRLRSSGGSRR